MTDRQTETTTAEPVRRGFGPLPCPCCGAAEASVSIDLDDLTGDESCKCAECDNLFGVPHLRDLIAKWGKVIEWLDSAPQLSDD